MPGAMHLSDGQLLLCFCEIDFSSHPIFQTLLSPAYVKEKPPPCYDICLLTPLKLSQVVRFDDELHKQCHISEAGSRIGPEKPNVSISFKRDADGKLDPNGNYPEKGKTMARVTEFSHLLSILGEKLITRVERNKLRLQSTIGTSSRVCIQDARPEGAIYENELIKCIPRLKGKTFKKLQQHNFHLVCDLKGLSGNTSQIRVIAGSISGISFEQLSAFVCAAEACLEGSPPPVVDHPEASNPYLSVYEEDSWEEQCDKDCITGKMCETEMIDFMFDQTKEILGEKGFVYHNALILMTSPDSVCYMKEKASKNCFTGFESTYCAQILYVILTWQNFSTP
eukprot:jgi/Psemu1/19780/gm1.19780_g